MSDQGGIDITVSMVRHGYQVSRKFTMLTVYEQPDPSAFLEDVLEELSVTLLRLERDRVMLNYEPPRETNHAQVNPPHPLQVSSGAVGEGIQDRLP